MNNNYIKLCQDKRVQKRHHDNHWGWNIDRTYCNVCKEIGCQDLDHQSSWIWLPSFDNLWEWIMEIREKIYPDITSIKHYWAIWDLSNWYENKEIKQLTIHESLLTYILSKLNKNEAD